MKYMDQFNRFSDWNFTFRRSTEQIDSLRDAHIHWIEKLQPNKFVTICFDNQLSMQFVEKLLNQWFRMLHCNLYRKPAHLGKGKLMDMHGVMEYARGSGDIHCHIAVRVTSWRIDRFDCAATSLMKKIAPRSRVFIEDISDTDGDRQRVAVYMTKNSSFVEWWRPDVTPRHLH